MALDLVARARQRRRLRQVEHDALPPLIREVSADLACVDAKAHSCPVAPERADRLSGVWVALHERLLRLVGGRAQAAQRAAKPAR